MRLLIFTIMFGAAISLANAGVFAQESVSPPSDFETSRGAQDRSAENAWAEVPDREALRGYGDDGPTWDDVSGQVETPLAGADSYDGVRDPVGEDRDTASLDDKDSEETDRNSVLRDEEGGPWPMSDTVRIERVQPLA